MAACPPNFDELRWEQSPFERLLQLAHLLFIFSLVRATSPGEKAQQALGWLSLHLVRKYGCITHSERSLLDTIL